MDTMERMPQLRSKMVEKLGKVAESYECAKCTEGQVIGDRVRLRLAQKKRQQDQKEDRDLEEMIQLTAQTSALQAINLS